VKLRVVATRLRGSLMTPTDATDCELSYTFPYSRPPLLRRRKSTKLPWVDTEGHPREVAAVFKDSQSIDLSGLAEETLQPRVTFALKGMFYADVSVLRVCACCVEMESGVVDKVTQARQINRTDQ